MAKTKKPAEDLKTISEVGEYEGHKIIKIYECDGVYRGKYPIISVGVKKAKAILNHAKDLEAFIKENES